MDKPLNPRSKNVFILLVLVIMLSGCAQPATPTAVNMAVVYIPTPVRTPDIAASPVPPSPTFVPTATPTATSEKVSISAPAYLAETLSRILPDDLQAALVQDSTSADVKLEVGEQNVVSRWIYTLVTPFPTTIQGVAGSDLLSTWLGQASGPFADQPLLMDQSTSEMLSALWGSAAPANVMILAKNDLLDYAWAHQRAWAIVPFEALDPRWKVLAIDGLSPIHKDFDPNQYRLTIPISLNGDPELIAQIASESAIPSSNRDPQKMTVVAMTGVTALVRATAYTMEKKGMTYPDQDIRAWLLNADITHISNEVPFAENCPYPNPVQSEIRFCSRDKYIELLEDVGTDVVELTGDHFQDWGTEAMFHTLAMYQERGWLYYGGGSNLADGRKALLMEHNQNRIAFIGCNAKGGSFAQASDTEPGAAVCDMDWMAQEVSRLAQEGYLVIATFQHREYYTYAAQPDQQRDFHLLAESGAVIVSGSQAHQPQGMEFLNGSFIHYGLGNLFFDQYGLCPACRQGFIDLHVFYDGRYLSTELLPIEFIDYARSRPMTEQESTDLFQALFQASGWQ